MGRILVCLAGMVLVAGLVSTSFAAETTIGGQYRINAYSVDSGIDGQDKTEASRLRFRTNINTTFNDDVSGHLQLEVGHIGSADTTEVPCAGTVQSAVELRHALLNFALPIEGWKATAGLFPWSDKFGDTLTSGDWDFNILGLALTGKVADGDLVLAKAKAKEGAENKKNDDFDLYVAEYDCPISEAAKVGVSYYGGVDQGGGTKTTLNIYGARGGMDIGDLNINGFLLTTKKETKGTDSRSGNAIKIEAKKPIGNANLAVMFLNAKKVTRVSAGQGYWGYTGILTIQGPTDTGFDDDQVNIGNPGGMRTIQAKVGFPIIPDKLDGTLAAGIFKATEGTEKDIGTDLLAMAKYDLTGGLAVEFGLAKASLDKGHPNTSGKERDVTAVFARLQGEF